MVQLDYFHRLEERRGLLGEMHRQHRTNGEVRGDEYRDARPGGQPRPHLLQPFVGEAGGSHDGMNAIVDQKLEVRHDHGRDG